MAGRHRLNYCVVSCFNKGAPRAEPSCHYLKWEGMGAAKVTWRERLLLYLSAKDPVPNPRWVLLKTFITTKCWRYMTVSCHKLVGLPEVGTGAGAPRAGDLVVRYRLSYCLEGTGWARGWMTGCWGTHGQEGLRG